MLSTRWVSDDSGATAVVVAVALLVLLGFASFAIDIGLGFDERRDIQNAADNAALAAAFESCNPKSSPPDPTGAGLNVAASNGFSHDPTNGVSVTVAAEAGSWRVTISVTGDTTIGVATPYASDQLTVSATAIARCSTLSAPGPYAIFALGSDCGDTLNISGSAIDIDGNVHTNGQSNITGDIYPLENAPPNRATYSEDPYTGYVPDPAPQTDYPFTMEIEDFNTAGGPYYDAARSEGKYFDMGPGVIRDDDFDPGYATITGSTLTFTQSGLYYAPGSIQISRRIVIPEDVYVTFASDGEIDLQGFDMDPDGGPYSLFENVTPDVGIFLFSSFGAAPNCTPSTAAIKVNGSDLIWEGVIHAPVGIIEMNASGNVTAVGSILGWEVSLSGSSIQVTNPDTTATDPHYDLALVD